MSALPFKLARACCKMHFLYNLPLSELHDKEVIKTTVYLHNLLAVLYPPSKQSCLLSFWVRRRKEGSAWTASSLIEVTAAWTFRTVSLVFSSQTSFSWVQVCELMHDPPPPRSYLHISRSGSCTVRSNKRKNRKRAGDSFPARSLFLSPQPPHDKEASAEERGGNGIYLNERCGAYSILRSSNGCSFDSGVYIFTWTRQRIFSFS